MSFLSSIIDARCYLDVIRYLRYITKDGTRKYIRSTFLTAAIEGKKKKIKECDLK